jgi:hypothetical protein
LRDLLLGLHLVGSLDEDDGESSLKMLVNGRRRGQRWAKRCSEALQTDPFDVA